MRYIILLFALVGCMPLAPELPEMDVWFQGVPEDMYAYDPAVMFAFQAHAMLSTADSIFRRLDREISTGWWQVEEGVTEPGLRAGHRWYIARDEPIRLKFTAWNSSTVAHVILDYPNQIPKVR